MGVEDEPSTVTKSKKVTRGKTPGELINVNDLSRPQIVSNYPQCPPFVPGTHVNMGYGQQAFFHPMFHGHNLLQDSWRQQICPSGAQNGQISQLTQQISSTQVYAPYNINKQAIESSQIQNSWQSMVTGHYNEELPSFREDSSQNGLENLQPDRDI